MDILKGAFHRLSNEYEILAEIGRVISSSLDIEEVYQQFAKEAKKLIDCDRVAVYLVDLEKKTVTATYVAGMEIEGLRIGDILPLEQSILSEIIESRSSLVIHTEDVTELDPQYPFMLEGFKCGLRSFLSIPLIFRDKLIGVLNFRSKALNAYSERDVQLGERIAAQIAGALDNSQLFLACRRAEENLRDVNTALKVLLKQREEDIIETEEKILANVEELVFPYIEKLKISPLDPNQTNYLTIIDNNLKEIISPFLHKIRSRNLHLTPQEIQIAQLIKSGKTTKEISELLNISEKGIEFHRGKLRRKLGLKGGKNTLSNHLSFLQQLP